MKQAERRKFHYIYKITRNDESGKFYIGLHSTDDLEDGYFGSGMLLWKSIKKHGKEKHSKEILEFLPSRQELKTRERELITEELRADPKCMNIAQGGGGFADASRMGRVGGRKVHAQRLGLYQQKHDEDRFAWSAKGGKKSIVATQTPAAREKRKMTFAVNNHSRGDKNSQFGSCWVTNGVKPIKIKKEQLEEYLANGYSRGRTYAPPRLPPDR